MRHFYLRNAAGFPVCCVATTIVSATEPKTNHLVVRYARSVYNLKDAKPRLVFSEKENRYKVEPPLAFNRQRHINAAQGRLGSNRFSHVLCINTGPSLCRIGVKAAVVRHIADHDTSQYAREAAILWLTQVEATKVLNTEPTQFEVPAVTEDKDAFAGAIKELEGTATFTVEEQEPMPPPNPEQQRDAAEDETQRMNRLRDDRGVMDRIFADEGKPGYPGDSGDEQTTVRTYHSDDLDEVE